MLNITSTVLNDILTKRISVCYCGFWSPVRINSAKQCWHGSTSRYSFSDNELPKCWNEEILMLSILKFWSTMTYTCLFNFQKFRQSETKYFGKYLFSPLPLLQCWNFDVSSNSKLREANIELGGEGECNICCNFPYV